MNDLDSRLRSVAQALVKDAPAPPPFPNESAVASTAIRRPIRYIAAAAVAASLAAAAVTVTFVKRDDPTSIVVSDEATEPPPGESYVCDADPALQVTVPGATAGPTEGPAPNARPLAVGQRAIHWRTAEGAVELRWPARTQQVYADGTQVVSTLPAGETVSRGRAEIDVAPPPNATDPTRFDPDVVLESREGVAVPPSPCDLLELTVVVNDGRWHTGLRPVSNGGSGQPAERVDLQPRITERRSVDVAPRAAVRCQGADQHGTPANRTGGRDRSMSGPQPADVLLAFLRATPGAPPSGYIELTEPDGSITYAVDPSGIGWTTLIFVAGDGDDWYLDGWTSSGC